MADSVKRVVGADVYAWMTPIEGLPGRHHHNTAARGDEIEVSAAEAKRGGDLGLLQDRAKRDVDVAGASDGEAVEADAVVPPVDSSGEDGDRPPQVAAKGVWVDYAVGRGMDRAEAESMTKQDLVERA